MLQQECFGNDVDLTDQVSGKQAGKVGISTTGSESFLFFSLFRVSITHHNFLSLSLTLTHTLSLSPTHTQSLTPHPRTLSLWLRHAPTPLLLYYRLLLTHFLRDTHSLISSHTLARTRVKTFTNGVFFSKKTSWL